MAAPKFIARKEPTAFRLSQVKLLDSFNIQSTSSKNLYANTDRIPARLVLYFLSWSGFLVSFMMRNDINFALVAMVRSPTQIVASNGNASMEEPTKIQELGEFEWSSAVTSVILGSFYWCYVLSQVKEHFCF